MTGQNLTETDIQQIHHHGLSRKRIEHQLAMFAKGVTVPALVTPCTAGKGVQQMDDTALIDSLMEQCDTAAAEGRITKFVPASGAATRMFKALLAVYHDNTPADRATAQTQADNGDDNFSALVEFMDNLSAYAFYEALENAMSKDGLNCDRSLKEGDYQTVLEYLLTEKGLHFAGRPKGMIPFHRYTGRNGNTEAFTAFEEHIAEAAACFTGKDNACRLHFTVPGSHRTEIEALVQQTRDALAQNGNNIRILTSFSIQDPSTDTIAADMNNTPFRDENGGLVFRPGGHGALLDNLNAIKGDILLIKNIDNVAKPALREKTAWALKAICGMLVDIQSGISEHVRRLRDQAGNDAHIAAAMDFISRRLHITLPESMTTQSKEKRRAFLLSILNRPTRVCGVVKNEGEPGGGPFFVRDRDGMVSGQIIESAQVAMNDPDQKRIWESATHFNPVIIACGVRDTDGNPFDLKQFADPDAGIITEKSYNGRTLKALEHPGLWNGAMAFWNTAFVEVPSKAFNPVKTVFDLLRDGHRPDGPLK